MQHRPNNKYGENLFASFSSDASYVPTPREAIKSWYDEIKMHKFNSETINMETLHFSQVVWKDTTDVGIAMAKGKKGMIFVVANYEPRGNTVGDFTVNVPKPQA